MKVRIGHSLDGSVVHVDTTTDRLLVLFGEPGQGKTTLARYLTRWWIADPDRTARIFAARTHEYTDLMTNRAVEVHPLVDADEGLLAPRAGQLTVVDGADGLPRRVAAPVTPLWPDVGALTVLTSTANIAPVVPAAGWRCLGLVPRPSRRSLVLAHRDTWDGLQGRLDWPPEIVAVVPETRGERDFPVHRWQVLGSAAG